MSEDSDGGYAVASCFSIWMFGLYVVGAMIVGQVVWAETGILWDTIKMALFWPITAAVMVADIFVGN